MKISLLKYSVLASNLTWQQVNEAIDKAGASPAAEHFLFYSHPTSGANPASAKRFDLLAMPKLAYAASNKNASGFFIEVQDAEDWVT